MKEKQSANQKWGNWIASMDRLASNSGEKAALTGILALAAGLDFIHLGEENFGNPVYAAAVKSMLTSWHNFFFLAFDPAGFISLDKAPVGYWLQALSALVFRNLTWSLLVPQAIAGVVTVWVVYRIVRPRGGSLGGILAALFTAAVPVMTAANRNNAVDSLVILTCVLAVSALLRAIEKGRLRWLVACMVIVGLGFNIKMLEAYLILPACLAAYLLFAPQKIWRRLGRLTLTGLVLVVVSFCWIGAVDLTPASQRPYVGGSQANREMDLAFNYNGLARLIGLGNSAPQSFKNGYAEILPKEIGVPGPLRLFSFELAGQVSWLLPLAILSLVWLLSTSLKENPPRKVLVVLFGVWLVTGYLFFSFSAWFHRYYLVMLAPPIAGLGGMGLASFWNFFHEAGWKGRTLPLVLMASSAVECAILLPYPGWNLRLVPITAGLCLLSAATLAVLRFVKHLPRFPWINLALAIGVSGLALPQIVWAGITVAEGEYASAPFAGPDMLGWKTTSDADMVRNMQGLVNFLEQNHRSERFLVGSLTVEPADYVILLTGQPAMDMGGFLGTDPILTPETLSQWVASGQIRYFSIFEPFAHETRPDLSDWFQNNCTEPFSEKNLQPLGKENIIYDCKPR